MTGAVKQLLNSFDALSNSEKQEAAVELLRRVLRETPVEFPEETLVSAADELFLELDACESADGES